MARTKKKATTQEITKLSDAELRKQLDETYKKLFALNLQAETLQLHNHREIPAARRTIARLKTIARQRELAKGGRA
jgi:large subunit ribosomal protein L29